MKKLVFLFLTIHTALFLNGQISSDAHNQLLLEENAGSQLYVQFKAHVGRHLYTGNTFHDYLDETSYGTSLRIGWRSTGEPDWQKALNTHYMDSVYLVVGIGEEKYFGNPIGTYGFFNIPIFRRTKHNFSFELSPGVVFNLNPYHPINNPNNDAVGSQLLLFFNFELGGTFILSRTLDLTYGIDYTHFSNGRIKTPNYGINVAGINLGLRYNFNPISSGLKLLDPNFEPTLRPTLDKSPKGPAPKSHDVNIYAAVGPVMYELHGASGPEYTAWTVYTEYARRYAHIASFNVGVDFLYDGSIEQDARLDTTRKTVPYSKAENYYVGLHIGQVLHIHKFSVELQYARYLYKSTEYKGNWYLRTAMKYQINKRIYVQIGLKTKDAGAADWSEFGIGYTLFRRDTRK